MSAHLASGTPAGAGEPPADTRTRVAVALGEEIARFALAKVAPEDWATRLADVALRAAASPEPAVARAPAAPADAPPSEREAVARWLYAYYHTARRLDAPDRDPGAVFYEDADELLAVLRAAVPESAAGEPQTYDRGGLFVGAPDVREAVQSIARCLAFSPGDQSLNKRSAWVYGIVLGWDDALPEVAARHRWSPEDVARLERLHKAWAALSQQGPTGEGDQ